MNDDNNTDTIVTFQEYMLSLEYQNKGFSVTFYKAINVVSLVASGKLQLCVTILNNLVDSLVWML